MVKSFPTALRWRVIFLSKDRLTINQIAKTLKVGHTFVKKVRNVYRTTSGVDYQKHHKGRPRNPTGTTSLDNTAFDVPFSLHADINGRHGLVLHFL